MNRLLFSILCLFVLVSCGGCGASRATLFVDNDSKSSLDVSIDGEHELYVGKGKHAKCFVRFGEHQVTVKRDGKVIFDATKTFEPNEDGTSWRHYILDPDADTQYEVREYDYYADKEKAKKAKSRKIRSLAKKHWVDVPNGVTALTPMVMVFTSDDKESVKRRCVVPKSK